MSSLQPTPRPPWMQSLHALIDPDWIRMEADALLEEATSRTGLTDFGDEAFLEPYRIFVRGCEEEAQLHPLGRLLMRTDLMNWLENRLRLAAARKQHPEIAAQEIDAPLFITGLPRTGTSILHELLACDPAVRAPQHWEVRHPCPAPETRDYANDPRIARADREVQLWNEICPEYASMHELGGQIPVECIQITAHEFRSDELLGRAQVPSYGQWLAEADLRPAYRFHRAFLQHLQWKCPGRWVLKAPSHLAVLASLFAVYPDARIIWTHRDPLKVIPSVASILYATARIRSDAIDPDSVLAWFTGETCRTSLDAARTFRESGAVSEKQFHDVRYADLMQDPIETIRTAYQHFGIEFSTSAEQAMRNYLASKPKGKYGAHRYGFAETGLDPVRERKRFADYQKDYSVASEV